MRMFELAPSPNLRVLRFNSGCSGDVDIEAYIVFPTAVLDYNLKLRGSD